MDKVNKNDIKPFKFSEINPEVIKHEEFIPKEFSQDDIDGKKISFKELRTERALAEEKSFKIDDRVEQHRGIKDQYKKDLDNTIQNEVEARINQIKEEAYKEAYDEGYQAGSSAGLAEAQKQQEQILNDFVEHVETCQNGMDSILVEKRDNIYRLFRSLTKWIALKEFSEDSYLPKLLEKLIYEINTKDNLVIKVNSELEEKMSTVIPYVESRIGQLSNVRVEVDLDLDEYGIILESENGILDGSMEAQFAEIDKVFSVVGVSHESA